VSKDKILVVEDAPDISSLLKIYFTSQGYEVMTAMRGQVALDLCRKTPPNLKGMALADFVEAVQPVRGAAGGGGGRLGPLLGVAFLYGHRVP